MYAAFLLFLAYRAFWLKLRVADLTDTAAMKCGLTHIVGRRKKEALTADQPAVVPADDDREVQSAGTVTSVSPQPTSVSPQPPAAVTP